MIYDIESFLEDVRTLLFESFNDAIDAVNTDKGDSLLAPVDPTNGYFLQNLADHTVNVDPFVIYGVANPVTDSVGQGLAVKYEVYCTLVVSDAGNDNKIVIRLMRYQRAMTDLFRENWGSLSRGGIRPKISKLNPFYPELVNLENAVAVGVLLSFTME